MLPQPVVPCSLKSFTEHPVHAVACPNQFNWPPGVIAEDGIDENEATTTAITNSAAYRAKLTQLGMVRGDVIQAGLLANPTSRRSFRLS